MSFIDHIDVDSKKVAEGMEAKREKELYTLMSKDNFKYEFFPLIS